MDIKMFFKKWGLNVFLVMCIVGASLYYASGKGEKVFNNVLKSKSTVPIHSVDTDKKQIAITVNAAYGKQYTNDILKVLKEENIKATFFTMGSWIDRYEESLKSIHKDGHEIGNNSSTYPHFTKMSKEDIEKEVKEGEDKISKITGKKNNIFRPPFGESNNEITKTLKDMGYYSVLWDIDSMDFDKKTEEEIVNGVLKQISSGSIILFHNNSEKTAKAMKKIIVEAKNQGYSFVRVSDLLYKDEFYVDHTGKQKKIN